MDTKELVERCKRGDRLAMGLLYSTYVSKLEQVSRKYLNNEADVQDVVHDSFVIILTSMDKLCDARKLESWMCTIVRNLSLRQARQPILEDVETVEVVDDGFAEAFDYNKLMAMVEQLPEGYKNVLKLSVLQGLADKELYEKVVEHRRKFYHVGYADYDKDYPAHITFCPPAHCLKAWADDYAALLESFVYGEKIPFDKLLEDIRKLEQMFHNS